jgi:small subunit ribosomal protein S4
MGDIKRRRRMYAKPRKAFDAERIKEENLIMEKYGLKNKREIWKADSYVSNLRKRAKALIPKSDKEKEKFFEKLRKSGFNVSGIAEVLAMTKEDLLERRLQTFVFKKGLANSPKQARQLIVHKYVLVDGNAVNTPSFIITKELEDKISLKERKIKQEKEEVANE